LSNQHLRPFVAPSSLAGILADLRAGTIDAIEAEQRILAVVSTPAIENLGFARGMNQGLEAARGEFVAFCNNDIEVPAGWATRLIETIRSHPNAGIVVPAITTATNPITVRSEAGVAIEVLEPFSAPPAGVVYLMRREAVHELGRWEDEYEVASGEDVDLCFKVWVNDLDVVFDQRVLVTHVSHATASKLDDWPQLWDSLQKYLPQVKKRISPNQPFGVCIRLSHLTAGELHAAVHGEL